jgi:hypothetical protein
LLCCALGVIRQNEITPDLKRNLTNQPVPFTLRDGLSGEIRLDKDFQSIANQLRFVVPESQNAIFKRPERIQVVKDPLVDQHPGG